MAIAEDVGDGSAVGLVDLEARRIGSPGFQVPGRITSLVADPSGRHLLALTASNVLYRWSRGDPAPMRLASDVTAAAWFPRA